MRMSVLLSSVFGNLYDLGDEDKQQRVDIGHSRDVVLLVCSSVADAHTAES